MNNIKSTWYAAYGIAPEFSGCNEPTLFFDPVVKEQDGVLVTWDAEIGDYWDPKLDGNFLCMVDRNDPENPRVREALEKWWQDQLKKQNKPNLQ